MKRSSRPMGKQTRLFRLFQQINRIADRRFQSFDGRKVIWLSIFELSIRVGGFDSGDGEGSWDHFAFIFFGIIDGKMDSSTHYSGEQPGESREGSMAERQKQP